MPSGASKIEQIPTKKLRPDPRNTRTHSDQQITKLMSSLNEFGFTNPVLIDKANNIIAGHGRLIAAKKLGWLKVPCIRLEYLTEAQKRAYIIADNKLAEEAGWDTELLKVELAELKDMDFDVSLTGFGSETFEAEIIELEADNPPVDKKKIELHTLDDFPELPTTGMYDFPIIRPDMILTEIPDKLATWVGQDLAKQQKPPFFYNYGSDSTREMPFQKTILGFYVDDYRFERFYIDAANSMNELLKKKYIGAVMPNFSTYFHWAKAIRLFSIYKSRWVGRYMQEAGMRIIPDLTAAPDDLECILDGLDGIKHIAMQAHQNYDDKAVRMQKKAVIDYTMEQIKPDTVLLYAPEDRLKMFPSLSKARVVRVEPRMTVKTKAKKAQTTLV